MRDWFDYESPDDLPVGLFFAAGYYKDDPDYVFTSLFCADAQSEITCLDPDFQTQDPKAVVITHISDLVMPSHPEAPNLYDAAISRAIDSAQDLLIERPDMDYEIVSVIEDLISQLEVPNA